MLSDYVAVAIVIIGYATVTLHLLPSYAIAAIHLFPLQPRQIPVTACLTDYTD